MQDVLKYLVHPLAEKCMRLRQWKEANMDPQPLYMCGGRMRTFTGLMEHWHADIGAAHMGLTSGAWRAEKKVPWECYAPTEVPYFLSFDNAPAHSLWTKPPKAPQSRRRHLTRSEMPLSLLQIIRINPKGHDIHQVVEHSIGAIKGHVGRELVQAVENSEPITTDLLWELVQDGTKLFDAQSWRGNQVKLTAALKVVAAQKDELVQVEYPVGKIRWFPGQAGNYAPMFLS